MLLRWLSVESEAHVKSSFLCVLNAAFMCQILRVIRAIAAVCACPCNVCDVCLQTQHTAPSHRHSQPRAHLFPSAPRQYARFFIIAACTTIRQSLDVLYVKCCVSHAIVSLAHGVDTNATPVRPEKCTISTIICYG